jgi:chromosome segregation ATPase
LLIVSKGAVQPTADEILAVAREPFLEVVNNFFKELHTREVNEMLDRERDEVDRARARLAETQAQLQRRRAGLRDITHRVDVSPETLRGAITRLEDERDKLALDAESQAVRKKAIEQTIAKIAETAEKQMKTDRIAVELEKLVASREAEMTRMQKLAVAKTVSQAEVEAAEARVGEARVRLWERQEVVSRTAGGDLLADLNKELAMLSINMAESEARLDRLGKAVSDYSKAVDLIDELESAQASRQAAEAARVDAEGRLADRARGLREYGPPVINFHGRK